MKCTMNNKENGMNVNKTRLIYTTKLYALWGKDKLMEHLFLILVSDVFLKE